VIDAKEACHGSGGIGEHSVGLSGLRCGRLDKKPTVEDRREILKFENQLHLSGWRGRKEAQAPAAAESLVGEDFGTALLNLPADLAMDAALTVTVGFFETGLKLENSVIGAHRGRGQKEEKSDWQE
jgi:hypothetical protein